MADVAELLTRVLAATEGSRELDGALYEALFKEPAHLVLGTGQFAQFGDSIMWVAVPAYTTDLSAALALVERVRPGWMYVLSWWPPSDAEPDGGASRCTLGGPGYISDETTTDTFEATLYGARPLLPLALLTALLMSLEGEQ